MKKIISVIAAFAILFTLGACTNNQNPDTGAALYSNADNSPVELGTGEKYFDFSVVDADGNVYKFHIHSDKTTVGEALQELGLIEGEEGDYGLYVKTVNGIFAEYETTGTYWAFYTNGEYAMTGIDMTEIINDAVYEMKIEN